MSATSPSPEPILPEDIAALRALVLAERAARIAAEAEATARARLIEQLRLTIAKLQHHRYGASAERARRLAEQLELDLNELGEDRAAAEARADLAEQAVPASVVVKGFARRKPARRPLPEHLPRERVVHPGPRACACCGGGNLRKLGEDVSEMLECVPAR